MNLKKIIFNHISVGGGVIGTISTINIINELIAKINKDKNFLNNLKNYTYNFAIIDKSFKNITGGVAYGFSNSKFGFFNNPYRLLNNDFKIWLTLKKNKTG